MEFISKYSDFIMAAFVVMVVGMMIIPLPTFLLDLLLTLNIAVSITILLVVLYISSAIRLAAFPSLLLIATLFRLALNVSTTRLILLNGDAGRVIEAFGRFVVQGDVIVGFIVFLILTLVNFIVISKGSERVAEVSARFVLDALPGKQMAIDADLRSGAIDMNDARHRRRALSRESQLFGAMDGAMKFVKGDAIAGILITAVNIVGGVAIGVTMRRMAAAQALKTYGLLTIGDGLLSQLPALVVSIAAGLMVTRVEPETNDDHLGKDISAQILSHPKALLIVSLLLLILGVIPGLPIVPFWALSLVTGAGGYVLISRTTPGESGPGSGKSRNEAGFRRIDEFNLSTPSPVNLLVGRDVAQQMDLTNPGSEFHCRVLPRIQQEIYWETGVYIPGIRVQPECDLIPADCFEVYVMDVPVHRDVISRENAFLCDPDDNIDFPSGYGEKIVDDVLGPGMLVRSDRRNELIAAGCALHSGMDLFSMRLKKVLRNHAADFLGLQEVKWLCEKLEVPYPDTVSETIPRMITYQRLSDVLRRLVQENVSIRDLKRILETVSEYAEREPDNIALIDRIRIRLGRQIFHQHARNGQLEAFLLDPAMESMFKTAIHTSGQERILAFTPDTLETVVACFRKHLHACTRPPVILTVEQNIRYVLWRFLTQQIPGVHVLSIQEIPSSARFIPLGIINVNT